MHARQYGRIAHIRKIGHAQVDLKVGNHYSFVMHPARVPNIRYFLYSLVILGTFLPVYAEFTVVREEAGITVKELVDPERTLPILKANTSMAASPLEIAAWVGAVHTYTQWQHNCAEAHIIPQADDSLVIYNRVASPWPVADRDVVLQSTVTRNADESILIEFSNREDSAARIPRGVVRMPRLTGQYELTPIDGVTQVIYTIDSDPGGKLPAWLVRRASRDLPFFTLKKLRKLVESGPPPPPGD